MKLSVYNNLKPVNSSLAFTSPLPANRLPTDMVTNAMISMIGQDKLQEMIRNNALLTESPDAKPGDALQSMFMFSKTCETPEQFAYMCYQLGKYDALTHPDILDKLSIDKMNSTTHEERQQLLRDIRSGKAGGDNHI